MYMSMRDNFQIFISNKNVHKSIKIIKSILNHNYRELGFFFVFNLMELDYLLVNIRNIHSNRTKIIHTLIPQNF